MPSILLVFILALIFFTPRIIEHPQRLLRYPEAAAPSVEILAGDIDNNQKAFIINNDIHRDQIDILLLRKSRGKITGGVGEWIEFHTALLAPIRQGYHHV